MNEIAYYDTLQVIEHFPIGETFTVQQAWHHSMKKKSLTIREMGARLRFFSNRVEHIDSGVWLRIA